MEMKALPDSNRPLVYQLQGSDLVNALPYIDTQIQRSTMKKIKKMINLEQKNLAKEGEVDYLEDLDEPDTPKIDQMLEILEKDPQQLLGKRDSDYNLEDPEEVIKKLHHDSTQLVNLVIYKKLGGNIKKVKLEHNKKLKIDLEKRLKTLNEDIKKLNETRKYAQEKIGLSLQEKETEIETLTEKNRLLEEAVGKLKRKFDAITLKKAKSFA